MKKILTVVFVCLVIGQFLAAEEGQPQIAYRILSDYLHNEEDRDGAKVGGAITMSVGFGLTMASAGAFFLGDQISANFNNGVPWDSTTKYIVSGSLLGSGLLTTGIGLALIFSEPEDPYAEYSEVFDEKDPVVQEAMAVAALKNLADEGKEKRLRSGFMNLAVPLVSLGVTMVLNVSNGNPWNRHLDTVSSWQLWSIFGGISNLFFQKSDGEKLYEKYVAAREAIFVADR